MPTIRIAYKGKFSDVDDIVNVFTFNSPPGPTTPSDTAIDTWLGALYSASFLAEMSREVRFDRWVVENWNSTHWEYMKEKALVKTGDSTGQTLPHQNSYMVVGMTSSRARGKKFFPGVHESAQDNGVLVAAIQTLLATVAGCYISTMTDGGDTWTPGTFNVQTNTFHPFTAARVDGLVHCLNRRFPGRGS